MLSHDLSFSQKLAAMNINLPMFIDLYALVYRKFSDFSTSQSFTYLVYLNGDLQEFPLITIAYMYN